MCCVVSIHWQLTTANALADRTGLLCSECSNRDSVPVSPRLDGKDACVVCTRVNVPILLAVAGLGICFVVYLQKTVVGSSSLLKILFFYTQVRLGSGRGYSTLYTHALHSLGDISNNSDALRQHGVQLVQLSPVAGVARFGRRVHRSARL